MEPAGAKKQGRPRVAEREVLRSQALQVVLELGYEHATMSTIAERVGVALRTLHRYFPTKADIVWGGLERSIDALRGGLTRADDQRPVIEAVSAVIIEVFDDDGDELDVSRARLRLIATVPELQAIQTETFLLWQEQLSTYIARRVQTDPSGLVPIVAAKTLQAAVLHALQWWAVHDVNVNPSEVVTTALGGLLDILGSTEPKPPAASA
ncbi:AcrR family transcriptional regulator [Curtobacterium flaccumfaciens]|uniref:AcrR family transcriptional regulator n=1 Tax=Curtobacterium salicis TaxID=1779862 RepID=A0ABX0TAR1_9MICO|nr:TetR family transcriptional regulator [Curtobacterium sp. WW7]NII42618.1 AcrR family transcriptional regulator [Curtobacterium sp. WW7]